MSHLKVSGALLSGTARCYLTVAVEFKLVWATCLAAYCGVGVILFRGFMVRAVVSAETVQLLGGAQVHTFD